VCNVWTWPSRDSQGLTPELRVNLHFSHDYNRLHWRPSYINVVQLAELDPGDILGLAAMILRNVPTNRIQNRLGATTAGCQSLHRVPSEVVSCIDYVFIDSDAMVRAGLLPNAVLDNPRDVMIDCYLEEGNS